MTEKRFGYGAGVNWQEDVIIDYETEKSYNFYEVGKLLNELHEKKEILELQLKSATNEIDKLMSEIDMLTDTCHDCCKEIRKENKELKENVSRLINDAIIEILDGQRYEGERILNKALRLLE